MHKRKEIEPDFVTGIFVFQIGTVCYIILSDALQIMNDVFPVDAKQRPHDCSVAGADP